jgi:hypothetical protein
MSFRTNQRHLRTIEFGHRCRLMAVVGCSVLAPTVAFDGQLLRRKPFYRWLGLSMANNP